MQDPNRRDRQLRRLTIILAFARSARRLRRLVGVAAVVAVVAVTVPAGAADGFGDVAADAYYAGAVESLAGAGVFDGTECGDGLFCPDEPIERWVMAVWLIRVLGGDITASGTSRFADVEASDWWSPYVEELADRKITTGCASDPLRYCPDNSVTRAQMASFLVRAYDLEAAGPAGLTDTAGSRHEANIDALTAAGITKGCGKPSEQKFCPEERTSRAQMAVFLDRVRGRGGEEPSGATDTGTVCVFGDRSDRVREAVWQVRTDGGIGTAFYIGDGEWLTAEHVVEGYGEVTLAWGGVELVATVEAVDADVDLGLLTGAEPSGVQPLRLGDVTSVTAGSDVYVVGYPLYAARSAAVSRGVLSRIERWTVEDNDHWTNTNMVVTDAAANPGNSGGPLVDSCGRVIGVITSKQVDVSVEGLAYAVSDVTVRPFLVLAWAGELDKGGSDSRVESNPEGNGSGDDDGAYRSDGWESYEGENRSGTYVTARTWVKVDEDDWFIVGIRCTAREDLDVYFYRSSADMGEHERGYVEWRFGDQQEPVGYWGVVSTTGTAVFLEDDDVWVFLDDLSSDGSGWLYAAMWGYDSTGYDWQGEGKLSVVGAAVVNDVLDACGQTANAEPEPEPEPEPDSGWTGSAYGGRGTVSAGSWKAHIEDPSTGMLVTLDCWQGGSPSGVLLSLTIGQWQSKWFHSYLIRYKVGEADWVLIGHDHLWHSSDQGQGRLKVFDAAWISEDTRPTKLFIQAIRAAETADSLAIEAWVNDDEDYGGDWHLLGEGEVDVWNGRQYVESTIAACDGAVGFQSDRVKY